MGRRGVDVAVLPGVVATVALLEVLGGDVVEHILAVGEVDLGGDDGVDEWF